MKTVCGMHPPFSQLRVRGNHVRASVFLRANRERNEAEAALQCRAECSYSKHLCSLSLTAPCIRFDAAIDHVTAAQQQLDAATAELRDVTVAMQQVHTAFRL